MTTLKSILTKYQGCGMVHQAEAAIKKLMLEKVGSDKPMTTGLGCSDEVDIWRKGWNSAKAEDRKAVEGL